MAYFSKSIYGDNVSADGAQVEKDNRGIFPHKRYFIMFLQEHAVLF